MVKAVTQYQASDGTMFASEATATSYEKMLPLTTLIASHEQKSPWTSATILLVLVRHAGEFITLLVDHLERGPYSTSACKDALWKSWDEFAGASHRDDALMITWLTRNYASIIKTLMT